MKPEDRAREDIDRQLTAAGWVVQDPNAVDLHAARGIAVREFPLAAGHGKGDMSQPYEPSVAAGDPWPQQGRPLVIPVTKPDPQNPRTFANKNTPWCEMFLPAPGGPLEVYQQFQEEQQITRGPEGIYMRPPDRPGFGFEVQPA